jgi:hypothetical protein
MRVGGVPHIVGKVLGYKFAFNLTSIKGLHKNLWHSKMLGVLILRISGLPTWESQEKMTF